LSMTVRSIEDLARILRKRGYSAEAVEEILKSYRQKNLQMDR
jgi:SOS response regulatory protein OraA/RecX